MTGSTGGGGIIIIGGGDLIANIQANIQFLDTAFVAQFNAIASQYASTGQVTAAQQQFVLFCAGNIVFNADGS
jgi:hypothetical protein